jgi:periplasmic divalent cation tolerance protein
VITISTTSDSKEILKNISEELLKEKLTLCTHIIKISKSSYIWKNEIVHKKEYKLEIKTTKKKENAVVDCIEKNHNYKVFEISKKRIKNLNKDYETWFKKQLI